MGEILVPQINSQLRERVDPQGDLPPVMLVPNDRLAGIVTATSYDVMHGEETVGEATIIRRNLRGIGEQYLARLELGTEEWRQRSLGLATMVLVGEKANKEGEVLRTDPLGEYLPAVLLWQTLVDRGVAQVVEPFDKRPRGRNRDITALRRGHIRAAQEFLLH